MGTVRRRQSMFPCVLDGNRTWAHHYHLSKTGCVSSIYHRRAQGNLRGHGRRGSRCGGHAREDYPERDDDNWMKHTLAWCDDDTGRVRFDDRPVTLQPLTNEVQSFPPKARVY